ncbi:MAG: glycerophosphodiester phosphodiesterase family protein, partial [Armatimonadetes bacterium]|nr:glycerophosphodiester phosphodiesterase family protein [Armatimonadota bacterium]
MVLAAMVLMMADGPETEAMIAASWERTLVVGHRGAAAYQSENTLPSFEEAIKSGADATECDVHLSGDGHLMVMHDETLDRTTSLSGRIDQTPSRTMIEAGVPTLGQLCDLTRGRIVLVVEIKGGEGVEQKVVDELVGRDMVGQSVAFSFSERTVAEVERLRPDLF